MSSHYGTSEYFEEVIMLDLAHLKRIEFASICITIIKEIFLILVLPLCLTMILGIARPSIILMSYISPKYIARVTILKACTDDEMSLTSGFRNSSY
jgi:capsular polysaccharide biosynthesis protein